MALLTAQKHFLGTSRRLMRGPLPNLTRFNIERSSIRPHGVYEKFKDSGLDKAPNMFSFYHGTAVMTPLTRLSTRLAPSFSLKYLNFVARRNPFLFGLGTACTKAFFADVIAQKIIEGQEKLNFKRTLLFLSFGALYSGVLCNALFIWGYPRMFPFKSVAMFSIASSFAENFINNPFVMFPILYLMKECILVPNGSLPSAWKKYKEELWETCITGWVIWIPAHVVTFGVVPVHLRMPYVSCVSFVFFTALSLQQNYFDERRKLKE